MKDKTEKFLDLLASFINVDKVIDFLEEPRTFEDTTNNPLDSYCSYRSEKFVDDELVSQTIKEWKNGKLIHSEGFDCPKSLESETMKANNPITDMCCDNKEGECQCNHEKCDCEKTRTKCCCDGCIDETEMTKRIREKVEGEYVKKLQIIEKELDVLSYQLRDKMALIEHLKEENEMLHSQIKSDSIKKSEFLNAFKAYLD